MKFLKSVTSPQIERLLLLLATNKDYQPCVSIPQLNEFLNRYMSNSVYGGEIMISEELLVDEDLFA